MTVIILLNWNGADDTLACLDSLERAGGEFAVVVADNRSTDDSLARLQDYVASPHRHEIHILPLDENYGFAEGNNRALHFAATLGADSYLLLNNDTEVEPDFLTELTAFAEANPQYVALTPQIDYFYDKDKVWFTGGQLTFGSRNRLWHDEPRSQVPAEPFDITFISGCALFFVPSLLDGGNDLLDKAFFFGEEDYEFSLRLQKAGKKMACVPASRVFHKVGASMQRVDDSRKTGRDYSFYLGKMIGCRRYYGKAKFFLLRMLMFVKSCQNFHRKGSSLKHSLALSCRLTRDARRKQGISREDFQGYMNM